MARNGGIPTPRIDLDTRSSLRSARSGDYEGGTGVREDYKESGRTPILSPQEIERLRASINPETGKRWTQSEIARRYGVSRQYVSKVKHKGGKFSTTPREDALKEFPIPKGSRQLADHPYCKLLRDHGEWAGGGEKDMSVNQLGRLRRFWKRLRDENLIVLYDPNIPPTDDNVQGLMKLVPRTPEDGRLLLRENRHTLYSDVARILYRLPNE